VGAVLAALRLEHVVVVRVGGAEQLFQRADVGQMRNRRGGVRVREPDAVAQAEAGVAVERHAELARQQFALHQSHTAWLSGSIGAPSAPRYHGRWWL
jgi:hypothetical protein